MRNFPVSLLHAFGPLPETSLFHGCRFACLEILVEIKTVVSEPFNHKFNFMLITRRRFLLLDLRRDVCRRHFCLSHSHMAHLWTSEAHAVADRVQSFVADN